MREEEEVKHRELSASVVGNESIKEDRVCDNGSGSDGSSIRMGAEVGQSKGRVVDASVGMEAENERLQAKVHG